VIAPRRSTFFALVAALGLSGCTEPARLEEGRLGGLDGLASGVSRDRLMDDVRALVDAHLRDTPVDCTGLELSEAPELCHLTRDKARELMRERLEAVGLRVSEQEVSDGRFSTRNLIAEIPGSVRPGEVVLVGAHYDAFYGGADDNSSGVAAVLELARVLAPHRFERTVRFVGFDLEEFGLVGSTRYVAAAPREERIVAALVLDTIGFRRREPGSQRSPTGMRLPDTGDFIIAIADAHSEGLMRDALLLNRRFGLTRMSAVRGPEAAEAPLLSDLLRSDHAPFWLTDRPALFLSDTANFRSPHYHQSTDTPDTLDPDFLAEVVRLCAVSLGYWAGGMP
jgi:Zn-dependent M28 family amino/carboxypeptidase